MHHHDRQQAAVRATKLIKAKNKEENETLIQLEIIDLEIRKLTQKGVKWFVKE